MATMMTHARACALVGALVGTFACAPIFAAGPAWAATDEAADPAALYEVVGEDAVLPLRRHPGFAAEVVASLPSDSRDIVLSGAAVAADGVRWVEVLHDDRAWAEASRLRAQAQDAPASDFPLLCAGTEPFWSLAIEGEEAVFETPDISPTRWFASEWLPARGLLGRYAIRVSSGYGTGYMTLLRQTCSDGMSDIAFPFEAILVTPAEAVRAGCCRRAGER